MSLTSFTSHPYTHPEDQQRCIDLQRRIRPPQRVSEYPSIADLYEMLPMPDLQAHTRVWCDDAGQTLAFAFVDEFNNLYCEADPQGGEALEEAVLGWAIPEARRLAGELHGGEAPETSCRSDNYTQIALLERHGFTRQPERALHFARPLDQPIPAPQLPPGFSIRPTTGADEVADWVALHRAAFGTEYMTVEYRMEMLQAPGHDLALDLVCAAPDGRLAAYCVGWFSAEENALSGSQTGYTDPVATHPDFQGRGLSKALLVAALRRLADCGMQTARLTTSSENPAMQHAAQAVGFSVEAETWRYQLG